MASARVRQIEAEIEETRARLNTTIDRIHERLTVAGIVDEVMGTAGVPRAQEGHDFVVGLLRRYPVPTMLAAAGLGYLVYRINRRQPEPDPIADADFVEVSVLNDGQARTYDPDLPGRHPSPEFRSIEAKA